MEAWQRDHVIKNLVELQELTICNAQLQSHLLATRVLHQADLDSLRDTGHSGKSSKLFEILRTRTNAYEELVKALFKCRQTGALKILMAGLRNNQVKNVLKLCKLPIDYEGIRSTKVEFQGHLKEIRDIFNINVEDLDRILETDQCQQDYLDFFVTHEKEFSLITETIPKPPTIYIPRFISNRLKVESSVFHENRQDVFVFKGINRARLSNIVRPKSTSTSTKQLQSVELTSQFILLDYDDDWCELKKMAEPSIHLISVECENEENCFILEDSVGGIITPSKPSDNFDHEKSYISEDELLKKISGSTTKKVVCICDTPGMGKTWLLSSLAQKRSLQSSKTIIAYLPLVKFIKQAKQCQTDLNANTSEPLKVVLKYLTPSDLSLHMLLYALVSNQLTLELYFDGFDEVLLEDLNWTKSLLKAVLEEEVITKVYVTARPHMRQELEITLSAISYDMLPFSEENQIYFLVETWKQKHPNSDESKLLKFANFCLQETRYTFKSWNLEVLGKPLQLFLYAEIYSDDAKLYSDPIRQQEAPVIKPTSLYKMYEDFFRLRFHSSSQQVKVFHIWKALELICPQMTEQYDTSEFLIQIDPSVDLYSLGILTSDFNHESQSANFVHRTFAEYLQG